MLVRKYKISIKYDPFYLLKIFQVANILAKGDVLLVKGPNSGVYFERHPIDLKHVNKHITFNKEKNQKEEYDNELWKANFDYNSQNFEYNDKIVNSQPISSKSQCI